MRRRDAVVAITGLGLASACASTKPTGARAEVADILAERSGLQDVLVDQHDEPRAAEVRERVASLLARPLTLHAALRVAMLNNRDLQATIERLGVAQADLVEAGLLANPTISGDLVNSTTANGLGGGLGLSTSLLSAFLIPAKQRVAKAQLQHAILTVGAAALSLVRDVKVAYVGVQAATARRDLHRTLVQTAEFAEEFSARLLEAGNTTELDRALFASELDEARLEFADAELALTGAREALNRQLGLWGNDVGWKLGAALSDPPEREVDVRRLEQVGIAKRLDLSAARFEAESIEYALKLRRRGLIPEIDVGVEARNEVGNDAGHEWVVGPSLSIELPIFNPGHADIARLGAQLRMAQHHVQAMAIDLRSHIRMHRSELVTTRAKAEYLRDTVLPRRTLVGQRALERYNAMLLGAFELLELRDEQLESQLRYVQARHDYWVARATLEWAVGGELPPPA